MRTGIANVLILTAGWLILFESPAYAYLDLSTGAYFVQILGGIVLAMMLSLRNKLKWFRGLFSRQSVEKTSSVTNVEEAGQIGKDE